MAYVTNKTLIVTKQKSRKIFEQELFVGNLNLQYPRHAPPRWKVPTYDWANVFHRPVQLIALSLARRIWKASRLPIAGNAGLGCSEARALLSLR
jgi:hypothetical protein